MSLGVFIILIFCTFFQLAYGLGVQNHIDDNNSELADIKLNCNPEINIYPWEFFWLYGIDVVSSIVNIVLLCFYDTNKDITDESPESEKELADLKLYVSRTYYCDGLDKAFPDEPAV